MEGRPGFWRELFSRRWAAVSLGVVGLYVLLAVATVLPGFVRRAEQPLPPTVMAEGKTVTEFAAPSLRAFPDYLLGTDIQNRSVFWRVLFGTRTALLLTLLTSVLALGLGVTLGVVAGYFGGVFDDVLNWLLATVAAVPWILLVLALTFVLKGVDFNEVLGGRLGREPDGSASVVPIPELLIIVLALGLTGWVGVCRLVRGEVLKIRALDYIAAARAVGLSDVRLLRRHVVPNVWHLVIITFTLSAVDYVQSEVVLTFLGVGISDRPSWGRMIDDAKLDLLRGVWWQFASATTAILIVSLALTFLGDALRDVLDPKQRQKH